MRAQLKLVSMHATLRARLQLEFNFPRFRGRRNYTRAREINARGFGARSRLPLLGEKSPGRGITTRKKLDKTDNLRPGPVRRLRFRFFCRAAPCPFSVPPPLCPSPPRRFVSRRSARLSSLIRRGSPQLAGKGLPRHGRG